jgi:hypothetical protein
MSRYEVQTVTHSMSVRMSSFFTDIYNAKSLSTALSVACVSIRIRKMLEELNSAHSYTISLTGVCNPVKPFSMMELTVDRLHVMCFTLSLTGASTMQTARSPSAKALTLWSHHGKNASSANSITLPFSRSDRRLNIWISPIYLQSVISLLAIMTVDYPGTRSCDWEGLDWHFGRRVKIPYSQTSVATQLVATRKGGRFWAYLYGWMRPKNRKDE